MFDFKKYNELLETQNSQENINNAMTQSQAEDQLRKSIDINPLIEKAQAYEVQSIEAATQALSMALQARKLATALISSKKEITKPQLDFQRAINKIAGDYIKKLEEIENNLKDKIENWIDNNTNESYSSGLDSIQVEDGSLKRVNTWCFEVECLNDVPFEFLKADENALSSAIDGGMREIPGVNIFLKKEVKLRVKN